MSDMTGIERLDTWVPIGFFVILWAIMQWHKRLPSTDSIQKFVAVINSRGGNIVILASSSIYFFKYSMYLFMHLLEMVQTKTLTPDNSFALMAIQFITTSAFGGSMGALLKTMTGESSTARSTDNGGNGGNGKSLIISPGTPVITSEPTNSLPVENPSSQGRETQGKTIVQPVINTNAAIKVPVKNQFP